MSFLRTFLPMLVLPTGIVCGLLIVGIARRSRAWLVAALALLYISSIELVGGRLVIWIESFYPSRPVERVERADAIVVLGGMFGPPSPAGHVVNLNDSSERLDAGIALHRAERAPQLVFTGARGPSGAGSYSQGVVCQDIALRAGVLASAVIVTRDVTNTADEANAIAELMREKGWRRVILVTSGSHMPRAAWLFERSGVVIDPFPVDFRFAAAEGFSIFDFIPNGASLSNTESVLREVYGNIYYRIFHRRKTIGETAH
jgi:uncharacterized SAM-binding protein YcdF (DUF218 family)